MDQSEKNLSLGKSLLILVFLLGSIFLGVIRWGLDPQIPIVLTTILGP